MYLEFKSRVTNPLASRRNFKLNSCLVYVQGISLNYTRKFILFMYIVIPGDCRGGRDAEFFGLVGSGNPLDITARVLIQ